MGELRREGGTMDANDETVGEVDVQHGQSLVVVGTVTGTITVTPQIWNKQASAWVGAVNANDGSAITYTASFCWGTDMPGNWRLLASGVSGGSCDAYMSVHG